MNSTKLTKRNLSPRRLSHISCHITGRLPDGPLNDPMSSPAMNAYMMKERQQDETNLNYKLRIQQTLRVQNHYIQSPSSRTLFQDLSSFCSAQHVPFTCDLSLLLARQSSQTSSFSLFDSLVYLGRICALKTLVFASRPLLEIESLRSKFTGN